MNKLDIVFIAIISLTLIRGFLRGIVKELIGIGGIIGGFIVATNYYKFLIPYVDKFIDNKQVVVIISYALLFVATLLVIFFIGSILREILRNLSLGWLDKAGGAAFGFIKGVLISSMILLFLTLAISPNSSLIGQSKLSPYITQITQKIIYVIPKPLKDKFRKKAHEIELRWRHSMLYELRHPKFK